MYEIHTTVKNRTVQSKSFNIGSDGFLHAKNGTVTVASIPVGNVAGVFRRGGA